MNHYSRGQTYRQRVKVLVDLLHLFGRLNPDAATKSVQSMAERLTAEIRQGHPACAVNEVVR